MVAKRKIANFFDLRNVPAMMDWNKIMIGEEYHVPPLIFNKRFDFLVIDKTENSIRIRKIGDSYTQTMFKTDITTRFIVKKQKIHGTT